MFSRSMVIMVGWVVLVAGACNDAGNDNAVPDNAYCSPVAGWPSAWVSWEVRIFNLMNQARAVGATCGAEYFEPTHALEAHPALRCAARVHSQDMHDRNFFDHVNPDGDGPAERFALAGWSGSTWGENIVAGNSTPDAQFDTWMASEGHCRNIMNPRFSQLGIGFFSGPNGYGEYATAAFGAP